MLIGLLSPQGSIPASTQVVSPLNPLEVGKRRGTEHSLRLWKSLRCRVKRLYFRRDRALMWNFIMDSITALLASVLQIRTLQLVFSDSHCWPYTAWFGRIFGQCLRTSKYKKKTFSDSHKYRKKHFKEKIIFLLFIKEVDFQASSCR